MSESAATERRHIAERAIFHDVAKALTSTLNLDSVLQTIMEKMAEYFRPDTWSLLMVDDVTEELYFAIAVGDASDSLKSVRLKMGEGIAGWVAKHGEPVLIEDARADPRFEPRFDSITGAMPRGVSPATIAFGTSSVRYGRCGPSSGICSTALSRTGRSAGERCSAS